jgi:hypothetical protein
MVILKIVLIKLVENQIERDCVAIALLRDMKVLVSIVTQSLANCT